MPETKYVNILMSILKQEEFEPGWWQGDEANVAGAAILALSDAVYQRGYVVIDRARFERLLAAAASTMGASLQPGDLDSLSDLPPAPCTLRTENDHRVAL